MRKTSYANSERFKKSGISRKDGGVDKALFRKMFGSSVSRIFKKELTVFKKLGLIAESAHRINLTYLGLLYPTETSLFFYLKKDREKMISWPTKILFMQDGFSQDK